MAQEKTYLDATIRTEFGMALPAASAVRTRSPPFSTATVRSRFTSSSRATPRCSP